MPNRGVLRTLTGVCLAAASAMANAAAVASAAEVPRPSPDFAINMTDGQKILVSQYKGKVCVQGMASGEGASRGRRECLHGNRRPQTLDSARRGRWRRPPANRAL